MAVGSIPSQGTGGENLVHIGGLRMRVVGSGDLRMRLISMDEIYEQTLVSLTMSAATNIQPVRLANFMQQRTQLEVKVTAINEYFKINRIIIYAKAIFTSHPG